MADRLIDRSLVYRDVFGAWRWEYRDGQGNIRDSEHGYDSREDCQRACIEAARRDGVAVDTHTGMDPPQAERRHLPVRTVLCVQPHPELRGLLLEALTQAGYETVFVVSGYEALRSLNAAVFDAYVLDLWLPDWSGVQLCREIRKNDPHAPVCFFTAAEGEDYRRRALRAGASTYATTSAGPGEVVTALRDLVSQVDIESVRARAEAERAVQSELTRRAQMAVERSEKAKALARQAIQRAARLKAYQAFIESGGNRANFDRWWPNVFDSASANLRPFPPPHA